MKPFKTINAYDYSRFPGSVSDLSSAGHFLCHGVESLKQHRWVACEAHERLQYGFYTLSGQSQGDWVSPKGPYVVFNVRFETKRPPRSFIDQKLKERVAVLNQTGQRVSRQERSVLRQHIEQSLIEQTLPGYQSVQCLWIPHRYWLIINNANAKLSDQIARLFENAFSLSGLPDAIPDSLSGFFYDLLLDQVAHKGFRPSGQIGVHLSDSGQKTASVHDPLEGECQWVEGDFIDIGISGRVHRTGLVTRISDSSTDYETHLRNLENAIHTLSQLSEQ